MTYSLLPLQIPQRVNRFMVLALLGAGVAYDVWWRHCFVGFEHEPTVIRILRAALRWKCRRISFHLRLLMIAAELMILL